MPLVGDEIRGCWESATPLATGTVVAPPAVPSAASERARRLDFVEVGTLRVAESAAAEPPVVSAPPSAAVEPGWSLWGDVES
jgi:hypothetical protein